ncbi:hypothetical protein NX059_001318 [Plenodomus lindquistii]|nr:hypothetical protein NX059_001318 [Plenodomus lindquistii]
MYSAWQGTRSINDALDPWSQQYETTSCTWSAIVARNCYLIAAIIGLDASWKDGLIFDHGLRNAEDLSYWDDEADVFRQSVKESPAHTQSSIAQLPPFLGGQGHPVNQPTFASYSTIGAFQHLAYQY